MVQYHSMIVKGYRERLLKVLLLHDMEKIIRETVALIWSANMRPMP
jgi:hypothetical protein